MISFDEALARVIGAADPMPIESVPLDRAHNRVLAAPVLACVDSPRRHVSSMDGYAVRTSDLTSLPAQLQVIGHSLPGGVEPAALGPGTAARIFTGAPLPPAADRVIIQEEVRRVGDHIIVQGSDGPTYVRAAGSDFRRGDVLADAGARITPRVLVAVAGADCGHVEVHRRPRTKLLATGDELVEPGIARERPGTIPESVSSGVLALAGQWGADPIGRQRLPDDLDMLKPAAAAACRDADLVVVTGGASVGERDFAQAMFGPDLDLIFSKVAIKPGKPVWLGRQRGTLVLGLPGNPTSALVTARLLLAPLLARLTGLSPEDALGWQLAPLAEDIGPTGDRETFSRGFAHGGEIHVVPNQDSGSQGTLVRSDLLIRRSIGADGYAAGELIPVLDF